MNSELISGNILGVLLLLLPWK